MGIQRAEQGHTARRPRRWHSSEFKARVALEVLKGQKTLNELASEFGAHLAQIAQWKRQLQGASAGIFENGPASRREREQLEDHFYLEMEVKPCGHMSAQKIAWLR